MALCPAHGDTERSLSVDRGDGCALVHCFGHCKTEDIMLALGLPIAALYDDWRGEGGQLAPVRRAPRQEPKPPDPLPSEVEISKMERELRESPEIRERYELRRGAPPIEGMGHNASDPNYPITFHLRDGEGNLTNVLGYQPDPGLRGDRPKMLGLTGRPRGPWPNPESYDGDCDTALWVEGESDVPAGCALGYPTFSAPSSSEKAAARWAKTFKRFRRVGVCGDPDAAGRRFAAWALDALKNAGIEAVEVDLSGFAKDEHGEPKTGYDLTAFLLEMGRDKAADLLRATFEEFSGGEREPAAATAQLLEQVLAFVSRYVQFASEHQAVAVALWAAHSHIADAFFTTPYLAVLSAEMRSGKTTLLRALGALCARSLMAASISEAALFRTIEEDKPTLFLDEVDALFGGNSDRSEPLRALLNAGNARDESSVIRCVGNQHDRRVFNVFCPKVLAGIDNGRFPQTVRDRSIVLRLRRGVPGSTEWWLPQDALPLADPLRDALAVWAIENGDELKRHRPEFPLELHARAAEGWWPLLSIADLAGGDWPNRAREAAKALSGGFDVDEETRGVRMLADLRAIFGDARAMFTKTILDRLNALEESPWGAWHDGTGMRSTDLARVIKPFGIKTKKVRVGEETARGLHRDDLEGEWAAYLRGKGEQAEQGEHLRPQGNGNVPHVPGVPPPQPNGECPTGHREVPLVESTVTATAEEFAPGGSTTNSTRPHREQSGNGTVTNEEWVRRMRARDRGEEW
jgi:hypothetical protein